MTSKLQPSDPAEELRRWKECVKNIDRDTGRIARKLFEQSSSSFSSTVTSGEYFQGQAGSSGTPEDGGSEPGDDVTPAEAQAFDMAVESLLKSVRTAMMHAASPSKLSSGGNPAQNLNASTSLMDFMDDSATSARNSSPIVQDAHDDMALSSASRRDLQDSSGFITVVKNEPASPPIEELYRSQSLSYDRTNTHSMSSGAVCQRSELMLGGQSSPYHHSLGRPPPTTAAFSSSSTYSGTLGASRSAWLTVSVSPQDGPVHCRQDADSPPPPGYRRYRWSDLDYTNSEAAERLAAAVDWEDPALHTTLANPANPLYRLGAALYRPGSKKLPFYKLLFRHVFPPGYFVNRNGTGRVPNGAHPPKRAIDPQVLSGVIAAGEHFCGADDPLPERAAAGKINDWLRERPIKAKLELLAQNRNLIRLGD